MTEKEKQIIGLAAFRSVGITLWGYLIWTLLSGLVCIDIPDHPNNFELQAQHDFYVQRNHHLRALHAHKKP